MITYSQNDPKWKKQVLGFDKTATFGQYGCLLTSLAIVATHYGHEIDPPALNAKFKSVGGFAVRSAYLVTRALKVAVPGMDINFQACAAVRAPMDQINACLDKNQPVILEVDWSPAAGLQTHYLVAHRREQQVVMCIDPYPYPAADINLGKSKYASIARSADPARIITGVFFVTAQTLAPVIESDQPSVVTNVDGLRLRSSPYMAASVVYKYYPLGTRLTLLKGCPPENIGVEGKWLHVTDADGAIGYVAAWFVEK